jgi:hypothetical protein
MCLDGGSEDSIICLREVQLKKLENEMNKFDSKSVRGLATEDTILHVIGELNLKEVQLEMIHGSITLRNLRVLVSEEPMEEMIFGLEVHDILCINPYKKLEQMLQDGTLHQKESQEKEDGQIIEAQDPLGEIKPTCAVENLIEDAIDEMLERCSDSLTPEQKKALRTLAHENKDIFRRTLVGSSRSC